MSSGMTCKPCGDGQSLSVLTTLFKRNVYRLNRPVSQTDKCLQPLQDGCANCTPTLICTSGYTTRKHSSSTVEKKCLDELTVWFASPRDDYQDKTITLLHTHTHTRVTAFLFFVAPGICLSEANVPQDEARLHTQNSCSNDVLTKEIIRQLQRGCYSCRGLLSYQAVK